VALTKPKSRSYPAWICSLAEAGTRVQIIVKLADILDNLSPDRDNPEQRRLAWSKYLPAAAVLRKAICELPPIYEAQFQAAEARFGWVDVQC
jgi:hypothetical protein